MSRFVLCWMIGTDLERLGVCGEKRLISKFAFDS